MNPVIIRTGRMHYETGKFNTMKMKDRVVIVTGGSSGIGKVASIYFAKEGAIVVVADMIENPRDGGKSTVSEILDINGISTFRKTDMTSEKEVSELFEFVVGKYDKVDVVVNNAGISLNKSALDTSADEFMHVIDNNLKSVFLGCKYAIKHMIIRKEGRIVNIGSNFSFVGRANLSAYVASKTGIIGLTRALAVEMAPYGINVNAVCPGGTRTEATRSLLEDPASLAELGRNIPLRKETKFIMEPHDVAKAILFIASDDAKMITGSSLLVDAGWDAW